MIKLFLLIFGFTLISTGYFQQTPSQLTNGENDSQVWSILNLQGHQERQAKPCQRRRNYLAAQQQWLQSLTPESPQPHSSSQILQPQALKNEKSEDRKPDLIDEVDDKDDLINAISDSDSVDQNLPERHSLYGSYKKQPDLNNDDCDELNPVESLRNSRDPNYVVIKILKDCLEKKQENIGELTNEFQSSRRSMMEPDENSSELLYASSSRLSDPNDANSNTNSSTDSNTELRASDARQSKEKRICYACSSSTNPSCWEPDQRTTVKYCSREHSCVTKTFGLKNSLTIIRDCAKSCAESPVPGIEPKFKSCKICHSDYCNGAASLDSYMYKLAIILMISIAKCVY